MADEIEETTVWNRTTAPQSEFTFRDVLIGLVVFVCLSVIAFAVPLVLG